MFDSVHLQRFPDMSNFECDNELVNAMDLVMEICNVALSIRSKKNIRVRQPLKECVIALVDYEHIVQYSDIIKDEINVKKVSFTDATAQYAVTNIKINFPELAKRLPKQIKDVIQAVKIGNWYQKDSGVFICGKKLQENEFEIALDPIDRDNTVSNGNYIVHLNSELNEDLILEGIARDFVRCIQQERKLQNLNISDRINIFINTEHPQSLLALDKFADHSSYSIKKHTLADAIHIKRDEYNYSQYNIAKCDVGILVTKVDS